MIQFVLDSSAVLAALNKEPGGDGVLSRLGESAISAVNFAEVVSKLGRTGGDLSRVLSDLHELLPDIRPFDAEQAVVGRTRQCRSQTSNFGRTQRHTGRVRTRHGLASPCLSESLAGHRAATCRESA